MRDVPQVVKDDGERDLNLIEVLEGAPWEPDTFIKILSTNYSQIR